ncbi:MAG: hypothetical protein M3O86_04315 [Actinomycetota bacterium]|nr:hypothetical protein [Actinomycetota bacterium]
MVPVDVNVRVVRPPVALAALRVRGRDDEDGLALQLPGEHGVVGQRQVAHDLQPDLTPGRLVAVLRADEQGDRPALRRGSRQWRRRAKADQVQGHPVAGAADLGHRHPRRRGGELLEERQLLVVGRPRRTVALLESGLRPVGGRGGSQPPPDREDGSRCEQRRTAHGGGAEEPPAVQHWGHAKSLV